jgi:RNA polymerase sigma-70 factor (ECF subfamily)
MAPVPPSEFAQDIHQRLLAGDPIAPSELAVAYLPLLLRWLQGRIRSIPDEHLITDAATDALLDYADHPTRFDPTKAALLHYLKMSAWFDLLNALKRQQRRRRREIPVDPVELPPPAGNTIQEDDDDTLTAQSLMERVLEAIPEPRDRQLLHLLLDGERRTRPYAEILGLQNHDELEQRRLVKRHKDRLKKRLVRLGEKWREPTS